MALQRRLLVAAVTLVISSLCPAGAIAGTLVSEKVVEGLLGAIASVAGSDFAAALGAARPIESGDKRGPLENEHLTKAVGKAIAHIIKEQAQSYGGETQKSLMRLAKRAEDQWVSLAKEEFALDDYPELKEVNLADVITPTENRFTQETCLSVPLWIKICEKLYQSIAEGRSISPSPGVFFNLAEKLHTLFPKALREVLKRDFAEKGEAFAGLSLSLLTEMRKKLSDLQKSHYHDTTLIFDRFEEVERHLRGSKAEQRLFFNELSQQLTELQSSVGRLEEKQDEVISKLGLLESEILPKKIWRCLLNFDYHNQQAEFDQFINQNPLGACLIRGEEKSAQPWLIHRLLTKSHYFKASTTKKIDCASLSQGSCLKKLICIQLRISENSSVESILNIIIQKLATQSVVFILKDVHATTSQAVDEFMVNFWQPLVNLYDEQCQAFKFQTRLVFIFVGLEGISNSWEVSCGGNVSLLKRSPFPHQLYPLTKVEPLSSDEVRKNLVEFAHALTQFEGVPEQDCRKVLEILEDERSLGQEEIFKYICEDCYGLNWIEFQQRWQHHYS